MRRYGFLGIAAVFSCSSLSILGFFGCSSEEFQPSPVAAAGAAGAAGAEGSDSGKHETDAGTKTPEAAPSCTPKGTLDDPDDAFEDSNCDGVDGTADYAVFVAPSGSDTASGSPNDPVATLTKAIEIASSSYKDVYVCNGSYPENVAVTQSVRIFGGYDCKNGWQRGTEHAQVVPAAGIPLRVSAVTSASFDSIDFVAPDAVTPSESSIAVSLDGSSGISFRHTVLDAGLGADGATGLAGSTPAGSVPLPAAGTGISIASCNSFGTPWAGTPCASSAVGGKNAAPSPCSGNAFGAVGGKGGDGGNQHIGAVATNGTTPFQGGAGGKASSSGGAVGAPGAAGEAGAAGVAGGKIGAIANGTYVATNAGSDGIDGLFGRGGGGGAGGWSALSCGDTNGCYILGSGGGQGGYGGCGGTYGRGGGAGGASIALLVMNTEVHVSSSTLITSDSGKGGLGGAGGAGQNGSAGAKGGSHVSTSQQYSGKAGGNGGKGGKGGDGGKGGGGPSVGILTSGTPQPTTESVTFELGAPGVGGTTGATGSMLTL